MANLKDTQFTSTGSIKLPVGTINQRPNDASGRSIRFNTDNEIGEFYNGSSWANSRRKNIDFPGLSQSNPAQSAWDLQENYGVTTNGFYWIQPAPGEDTIYTYCDFAHHGGGWTCIRSYSYANSNNTTVSRALNNNSSNENTNGNFDFNFFMTGNVSWRRAVRDNGRAAANTEFFIYVSNSGLWDTHAANNFVVVKPESNDEDFLEGSNGGRYNIPGFGRVRGFFAHENAGTDEENFRGSTYRMRWWFNNNSTYDPHWDTSSVNVPNSVGSENNFGYMGTRSSNNTNHFAPGQILVTMIR